MNVINVTWQRAQASHNDAIMSMCFNFIMSLLTVTQNTVTQLNLEWRATTWTQTLQCERWIM